MGLSLLRRSLGPAEIPSHEAWDFIVKIKKSTRPHVFRTFIGIMRDFRNNKK